MPKTAKSVTVQDERKNKQRSVFAQKMEDLDEQNLEKQCPKCGVTGRVVDLFGYRLMEGVRLRPQSQCRECRKQSTRERRLLGKQVKPKPADLFKLSSESVKAKPKKSTVTTVPCDCQYGCDKCKGLGKVRKYKKVKPALPLTTRVTAGADPHHKGQFHVMIDGETVEQFFDTLEAAQKAVPEWEQALKEDESSVNAAKAVHKGKKAKQAKRYQVNLPADLVPGLPIVNAKPVKQKKAKPEKDKPFNPKQFAKAESALVDLGLLEQTSKAPSVWLSADLASTRALYQRVYPGDKTKDRAWRFMALKLIKKLGDTLNVTSKA